MKRIALVLGTVGGFALGCYRYAPDHCGNNLGDASCPEGMFCDGCSAENDGCVDRQPEEACYLPMGFGDGAAEESSSGTVDPTGSASGGTTTEPPATTETTAESSSTTAPIPTCASDKECVDPGLPFCGPDGECVTCEGMSDPNGACAGQDALAPVCSDGACVACTAEQLGACEGLTPVCGEGNECVACTEHAQCPDSACHLDGEDRGACFDVAEVVNIANAGELTTALDGLEADSRAVFVLASGTYPVRILVSNQAEVAFIGEEDVTITGSGDSESVALTADAIAYFQGLEIVNSSGAGLECQGAAVWLDDSELRNSTSVGLDVTGGCQAHLRRTAVRANATGGIEISGAFASLQAENSLIVDNVGPGAGPGLFVTLSSLDITYSVIASNGTFANPDNLFCFGDPTGSIRNSVIAGPSGDSIIMCESLTYETNALDTAGLGVTNVDIGTFDAAWFLDPALADYHLTTAGETTLMDIATWQPGDPPRDVDGDPIPTGIPSFPGYDQP